MWYMHDFGSWWMVGGGLLMVLFWGGLIAFGVWGINRLSKHDRSAMKLTPVDIARERYAKGEITKEQFEQIRKDLG